MANVDLFNPRAMAQALIVAKKPRTFMRELCVRRDEEYNRESVDVDIRIGARRLAPFINPNIAPGEIVDRTGFSTRTYTAPMVAPKRPLTVTDMQLRSPGESIYAPSTPEERAARILGEDLAEMDETITRREEWMVAQAAFNSSIHVVGRGVDQTISFTRSAAAQIGDIGGGKYWDGSGAGVTILTDIRTWRRAFVKLNGIEPDFMVLGEKAADALISAPTLSGLTGFLNTRRLDLGLIKPELREGGATYIGQFSGTGIDIWGYDEWYLDTVTGVETPMVPANQILMGSSRAYTAMRYGAVGVSSGLDSQAQITLVTGRRVPESWVDREPAVRWLKISSRPLFVPVQNDAFLTAQVTA